MIPVRENSEVVMKFTQTDALLGTSWPMRIFHGPDMQHHGTNPDVLTYFVAKYRLVHPSYVSG